MSSTLRPTSQPIAPDLWRKVPPGVKSSVEILQKQGHNVAVRLNRNGSLRYSVDGARDMDAATMARRYKVD